MPLSRRNKIGVVVLIALMAGCIALLAWTLWGSPKPTHDFSDNAIVRQRMINLSK